MKTTIYLPNDLKRSVEREAVLLGTSEAEVIRTAIKQAAKSFNRPVPVGPLIEEDWGPIDWNQNDWLEGFGQS